MISRFSLGKYSDKIGTEKKDKINKFCKQHMNKVVLKVLYI